MSEQENDENHMDALRASGSPMGSLDGLRGSMSEQANDAAIKALAMLAASHVEARIEHDPCDDCGANGGTPCDDDCGRAADEWTVTQGVSAISDLRSALERNERDTGVYLVSIDRAYDALGYGREPDERDPAYVGECVAKEMGRLRSALAAAERERDSVRASLGDGPGAQTEEIRRLWATIETMKALQSDRVQLARDYDTALAKLAEAERERAVAIGDCARYHGMFDGTTQLLLMARQERDRLAAELAKARGLLHECYSCDLSEDLTDRIRAVIYPPADRGAEGEK